MNLPDGYLLQGKKYRLTHSIGQGGFGITYAGVWNAEVKGGLGAMKTTVPVCIKEYFFKDYCYREKNSFAVKVHSMTGERLFGKFKEKLIEEANILSAVHHPNIVNVLEVFEENNTAYIVMEYIKGHSLKYLLDKKGTLPENKVIKYTHQIGNALNFVHEKNIVHLDIKPGNILIDQDDNARLIDFGVSKRYGIDERETSTTTLTLSKGFASIEQYDNEGMVNFSPAPDIYSLGATMYNLLTGVIPVESILRATKQMPPPTAFNANISPKTEKAVLKAMEIKPKNRFRKVNELLAAIEAPDYEFADNKLQVTNSRIDNEDHTEVLHHQERKHSDDEEDKTQFNSSVDTRSKKKSRTRKTTRRRVLLTITILFCAYIGYAVFSYFVDITSSQATNEGFSLPDDSFLSIPDITLVNQVDSVEADTLGLPESNVETPQSTGQAGQQAAQQQTQADPAQTQTTLINNTQVQSQPDNTGLSEIPSESLQKNTTPETNTQTLTPAQRTSMEKDYQDFIILGKMKMESGGYKGANEDFLKASENAKKLGKDLSEVNKLMNDCKTGMEKQADEEHLDNYEFLTKFGDLQIVRHIGKNRYGALDASRKVKIPCIYKTVSIMGNNRAFIKDDNTADIYDKTGECLLRGTDPSSQ